MTSSKMLTWAFIRDMQAIMGSCDLTVMGLELKAAPACITKLIVTNFSKIYYNVT